MMNKTRCILGAGAVVLAFCVLVVLYAFILESSALYRFHYSEIDQFYFASTGAIITLLAWNPVRRAFGIRPDRSSNKYKNAGRRSVRASARAPTLYDLSPAQFEQLLADVLIRSGYRDVERVGRSSDLTIDVIAYTPDGEAVVVQCKRYAPDRKVGTPELQQFIGMAYTHHGVATGNAIYATTSYYTAGAVQLAAEHQITLLDYDSLTALIDSVS